MALKWPHTCFVLIWSFSCVFASLLSLFFLNKETIHIGFRPHTYDSQLTLIVSLKVLSPNTVIFQGPGVGGGGVVWFVFRTSTVNFEGTLFSP